VLVLENVKSLVVLIAVLETHFETLNSEHLPLSFIQEKRRDSEFFYWEGKELSVSTGSG
jgi:hypothetical protein